MGTKRQHEEDGAPVGSEASGTSTKRQKSYPGKKRKAQDDSGAKKRARAIERALRRNENLPADVRSNLQRELASQKQIAEDKAYRKKRSAMISRYHMVRFFERKKASRLAKQLKRKMERETDPAKIAKIERELHIAQVDETYTQYFPHLETYVGLYSANAKSKHEAEGDGDADGDEEGKEAVAKAALEAKRPPMWSVIEKAMEQGRAALERLRDRRSPHDSGDKIYTRPPIQPKSSAPARKSASRPAPPHEQREEKSSHNKPSPLENQGGKGTTSELNRRERRRLMRESAAAANKNDDGDEEEGGFFEELQA